MALNRSFSWEVGFKKYNFAWGDTLSNLWKTLYVLGSKLWAEKDFSYFAYCI